jgi:hypothetical protein
VLASKSSIHLSHSEQEPELAAWLPWAAGTATPARLLREPSRSTSISANHIAEKPQPANQQSVRNRHERQQLEQQQQRRQWRGRPRVVCCAARGRRRVLPRRVRAANSLLHALHWLNAHFLPLLCPPGTYSVAASLTTASTSRNSRCWCAMQTTHREYVSLRGAIVLHCMALGLIVGGTAEFQCAGDALPVTSRDGADLQKRQGTAGYGSVTAVRAGV